MQRRALLASLGVLAGCGSPRTGSGPTNESAATGSGSTSETGAAGSPTTSPTDTPDVAAYGLATVRADGNRVASGEIDIRTAAVASVSFPVEPVYVAGAPAGQQSIWAVVLRDGSVHGVRVAGSEAEAISLSPETVDGPPLLAVGETNRVVVRNTLADHTAPVPVGDGLAWVRDDGKLRTPGGVVAVDALPDAVPVADRELVYVLAGPTEAYGHGVLGDAVEATKVAVVDAAKGKLVRTLSPPTGVIEGRSAMVAQFGDDRGVVVTASDSDEGARIVVLGVDGSWEAVGPGIGTGFRWRHQLAVAPFGTDEEATIAAVKTPHVGGAAEFYRRDGAELKLVASDNGGYQSHVMGSRNLGGALAGKLVGDDRTVVLVPDGSRKQLVALHEDSGSVKQAGAIPLGGTLTSNVAAVGGGSPTVATGTENGLRIWVG